MTIDFGSGKNLARMHELGDALSGHHESCSKAKALKGFASDVSKNLGEPVAKTYPQLQNLAEGKFENSRENQITLLHEIKTVLDSHPEAVSDQDVKLLLKGLNFSKNQKLNTTNALLAHFTKGGGTGKKRLGAMVDVGAKFLEYHFEKKLSLENPSSGHYEFTANRTTDLAQDTRVSHEEDRILHTGARTEPEINMPKTICQMKATDFAHGPSNAPFKGGFREDPDLKGLKVTIHGQTFVVDGLGLGSDGAVKGSGSYGRVFIGHLDGDPNKKKVAIKIAQEPHGGSDLLQREANIQSEVAKVDSDKVLKIYGTGQLGNTFFTVMEPIDGEELMDAMINRSDALNGDSNLRILEDVAGGIADMHDKDLIHKDLKLENIMITKDNPPKIKIIDFGFTEKAQGKPLQKSVVEGTPMYIAPETAKRNSCGKVSDVYSFGAILYTMIEGKYPPYDENDRNKLEPIQLGKIPWDGIERRHGREMRILLERCLQEDINHRPSMRVVQQKIASIRAQKKSANAA